jgi:hypothetical protein
VAGSNILPKSGGVQLKKKKEEEGKARGDDLRADDEATAPQPAYARTLAAIKRIQVTEKKIK